MSREMMRMMMGEEDGRGGMGLEEEYEERGGMRMRRSRRRWDEEAEDEEAEHRHERTYHVLYYGVA